MKEILFKKTNPPLSFIRNMFLLLLVSCNIFAANAAGGNKVTAPAPINVHGKVTDEKGATLPGVTIKVKGTKVVTATDVNGNYTVSADATGSLIFSFIGYGSREVLVNGRSEINVTLNTQNSTLDEVVVVGYGTQVRKDLTGSVASIKDDMVKDRPIANLNSGLVGQIAGVDITLNDAAPGGETAIKIRGVGSIGAGNEPLYVVDGYPTTQAFANSIDPATIQSFDVLKDASATAIYGSRGSNGVIIITTKSGKDQAPRINFNSSTGVAYVAKRDYYPMLDGQDYVEFTKEELNNEWVRSGPGRSASDPNSLRPAQYQIPANLQTWNGVNTNWQDAIFNPALVENYDLNVNGGTDKVKYLFSGGYYQNNGIVAGTGFKKYTAQVKVDANVFKDIIQAGINIVPSYSIQRTAQYEGQNVYASAIGDALGMPSDIPVHNADGSYGQVINPQPGFAPILNPVQLAEQLQSYNYVTSLLANAYLKANITPDLQVKTSLGATVYNYEGEFYYPSTLPSNGSLPSNVGGSSSYGTSVNWLSETTIDYHKTFAKDHKIDLLAGYSAQEENDRATSASGSGYPNDLVQTLNAAGTTSGSSNASAWTLLSYYARLNYAFQDKYLLTATVRSDGSSVFGTDNKYGTFPSAAVAWVVSNENFLKDSRTISFMKLRGSYGISGNNGIGDYSSIGLLSYINTTFGSGSGSNQTGIYPSSLSNPDLKWEKSAELDLGLDLGLLKDRISVTTDYYDRHSTNLLLSVNLPTTTGFSSTLENIGEVENRGYEFSITTKNLNGDFKWSTNFNIAHNLNKVLALGPGNAPLIAFAGTHITVVGGTVGANYGLKQIGVLTQADISGGKVPVFPGETAGDPKYYDTNHDGQISNFNGVDAVDLGQVQPLYVFGFNNTFSYKRFDLNIITNGQTGGHIMDLTDQGIGASGANATASQFYGRYISDANPGNGRTLAPGTTLQGEPDTRLIQSSDYFRITDFTLGYTLPSQQPHFYKNFRIFMSIENVITWKRGEQYNPQGTSFGSSQNVQIDGLQDGAAYPLPRTISLGVNLTL